MPFKASVVIAFRSTVKVAVMESVILALLYLYVQNELCKRKEMGTTNFAPRELNVLDLVSRDKEIAVVIVSHVGFY